MLENMLEDVLEFSFLSLLFFFSHILTNIEFKHVTSTYYHSWYLIYIDFDITYIRRVIDI